MKIENGEKNLERIDGRKQNQLRKTKITKGYTKHAEGSVLIEMGNTKVLCNATVEKSVPPFLIGKGKGWVTAEYSMLPRATNERNTRDIAKLRLSPRSAEIQRLIGRALRGVCDLYLLGERSIVIDCDVIEADGGTRTAAITGGFIALYLACKGLLEKKEINKMPIKEFVCAISVGMKNGETLLDLCYEEDSKADVDMNVVMTENGKFIELQGTAEQNTFDDKQLRSMLSSAKIGITRLIKEQKKALDIK